MFMLYLPSSKFSCCCSKVSAGSSWYSSEGSTSTHNRNAKQLSKTYTYMQTKAKAKKLYNNT